jgi:hypothetical protein
VRAEVALDLVHYRIAADRHSQPIMRACAACKLVAWRGQCPTPALVAAVADVEPSVAVEVVELWHGRRPLEVLRPGADRAVEVSSYANGGPHPGHIWVSARALEAAADLTPMAGGPFHPHRRRRRRSGDER